MARGRKGRPGPADRYARLAGAVLVVVGVGVLLISLSGHGWLAALYLVSGLLGFAAAGSWARDYALGFGLLYAAIGIWGLAAGGGELFTGFTVGTLGSLFHLGLGLVGLGAGAATPIGSPPRPRTRRA